MSKSYQEQHPLLYEDLSEEEQFSPRYQRRRPMVYRGRAKANVKGAAAIIRLWPEHWSSAVTYWWIALGMIGLITIIVYNSIVVFAMLPSGQIREPRPHSAINIYPKLDDTKIPFNIYMHLFVDNNQDIDLNNYIPYIDIIANKYPDFKYHLIIVLNDTSLETNNLSAEENNEIALNLLWAKNNVHHPQKNNVFIEHVILSKYMKNSPLRLNWIKLPKQFIQFMVRAVSIWDKGGIAFNPTILTPRSPHAIYIERLQIILKNYHHTSKKTVNERKIVNKQYNGVKKRLNNIRDIIEALEHEDEGIYNSPPDISADEEVKHKKGEKNINDTILDNSKHFVTNATMDSLNVHPKFSNVIKNKSKGDGILLDSKETLVMAESKMNNLTVEIKKDNYTSNVGILPMFLEFLFNSKPSNLDPPNNINVAPKNVTRRRKHVSNNRSHINGSSNNPDTKLNENLKPLIVSAQNIYDPLKNTEARREIADDENQFTMDLKGNIVASAIPCHAFLGTMFSNAIHQTHGSLTDFIITELSIFCKGALSSCKGIDIILL